jgi:hypothetical protein
MKKFLCVVAACLAACGGASTSIESSEMVGADEQVQFTAPGYQAQVTLSVSAPVNLRAEASREASVLMVLPAEAEVTLLEPEARQGYLKVSFSGREGWAYGAYLRQLEAADFGQNVSALTLQEIDYVMARASGAVGIPYWWGHAVWGCGLSVGSCSVSTTTGQSGTDSSGLVSKSWHVPPSADASTCVDYHPYSTTMFMDYRFYWTQVSRSDLRKVDAIAKYGHMFLRLSGDGWGTMEVYECGGCTTGCAHRYRSATSEYIALRRNTGWL